LDQAANIQLVADDLVRQLGPDAYAYSRDFAVIAKNSGDTESAVTWWDIALAVIEVRSDRDPEIRRIA
jgi:hypothetical protein